MQKDRITLNAENMENVYFKIAITQQMQFYHGGYLE